MVDRKNTTIANRACPICDSSRIKILHSQIFVTPNGHPLSQGYNVVCCNYCGFVYADTTVSQEEYDLFYQNQSKYEDNKTSSGSGYSVHDDRRLKTTADCIAQSLPDKNSRILDIGCANGGLLGHLQKLGYTNLYGIDPSPVCVRNTEQIHASIQASVGSLFKLPDDLGDFDCIVFSHVLEHIQDIKSSLKVICELIKSNGYLYVEVPNALAYADYVLAPFQEFNTEHINHFSHPHLSNLLSQFNFTNKLIGDKAFNTSERILYPAIYGLWQKGEEGNTLEPVITSDKLLEEKILIYIERSSKIMSDIDRKIQLALNDCREMIVWGTGQLSMKLLGETSLSKANIIAFIDGNSINQGKSIAGIKVGSPDSIKSMGMTQPIVVTSVLSQDAILDDIKRMNIPNHVILLGE